MKAKQLIILLIGLIGIPSLATAQTAKAETSPLSYRIYTESIVNWEAMEVKTPAGIETGNTIEIVRSGELIAKFDAGMKFIIFPGSPLVRGWYSVPGAFLGAQYREMGNGPFHPPVQSEPTIEEIEGNYILSVNSKTDDEAIQARYSITISQNGSIYIDKTAIVPHPVQTDECSTEDGNIGIHLADESVNGGAHIEVYDDGELYSWDITSHSGWGNIDASHMLENGDWVSLTKIESDPTLKFQADFTFGYDNWGNPSPLAAVIQYGPGAFAVFVGRKGVTMWHPTALPAGEYITRGWLSVTARDELPLPTAHLLIAEVYYDVAKDRGKEGDNEWVKLYNPTDESVDASGWQICDNQSCDLLPSVFLSAGGLAIITGKSTTWDYWRVPENIVKIVLNSYIGNSLHNDNDRVILKNASGTEIDAISFGTDTYAFNPACPDILEGYSLQRQPINRDANQASDFIESEPSLEPIPEDRSLAQLIREKEIPNSRVSVTIEDQTYHIIRISCRINLEALECLPDSEPTQVYLDDGGNLVADPEIVQKINLIDFVLQEVVEIDLDNKIASLEQLPSQYEDFVKKDLFSSVSSLFLSGVVDIYQFLEEMGRLELVEITQTLTTFQNFKHLARVEAPNLSGLVVLLIKTFIADPMEEVETDLENYMLQARDHYLTARQIIRQQSLTNYHTAYSFWHSYQTGLIYEGHALFLYNNIFKNISSAFRTLCYFEEPLLKLQFQSDFWLFWDFVKLAWEAKDAVDWTYDVETDWIVRTTENFCAQVYWFKLPETALYTLNLAQSPMSSNPEFLHQYLECKEHANQSLDELIVYLGNVPQVILNSLADEYNQWADQLSIWSNKWRDFLKTLPDKLSHFQAMLGLSPIELRIYDSVGRVTGLVDGEIKNEIPDSECLEDFIIIYYPSDVERYEIKGTDNGMYHLGIMSVNNAVTNTFEADDIPTSTNSVHQYLIDWEELAQNQSGVQIQVDLNADGVFEQSITSDSELTLEEFVGQTRMARWLKSEVRTSLENAKTGDEKVDQKIDEILKHLDESLDESLWIDENHLDPEEGREVFQAEAQAVRTVRRYLRAGQWPSHQLSESFKSAFDQAVDDLVKADEMLAEVAIEEAKNTPVQDQKRQVFVSRLIHRAEIMMAEARGYSEIRPDMAVAKYGQAWRLAQMATRLATGD